MRKKKYLASLSLVSFIPSFESYAEIKNFTKEEKIDYKILEQDPSKKQTYLIDKIEIRGTKNLDEELVRSFLSIKEKKTITIPSTTIKENINTLLDCDFIEYVACYVSFVDDIHINLIFEIIEYPIIEGYEFVGITQKNQDKLIEKIKFEVNRPASTSYLNRLKEKIKKFYVIEKGCKTPEVKFDFVARKDLRINLKISLPKIQKTYINHISFIGNNNVDSYFLKPELSLREKPKFTLIKDILYRVITLQPFKENGYLRTGYTIDDLLRYFKNNVIFIPRTTFEMEKLNEDKKKILNIFSKFGYNDAEIKKTRIKYLKDGAVDLEFVVDEGKQFYINNLTWTGNTRYDTKFLNKLLKVKRGDLYSLAQIKDKIYSNNGGIFSLYQDYGYLTSSIEPIIVGIDGDKVDLEMRVYEGDVYKINEVLIVGNTNTFDDIIRRRLFVRPGDTYSRSDIILSMQSLSMSNLFDMQKINPMPININKKNKTTDIVFNIKEAPKMKVQATASSNIGGGDGKKSIIWGVGFDCNNISIIDMFKFRGVLGGGQNLHLAYQFYSLKKNGLDLTFADPILTNERFPWGYNLGINYTFDNDSKDNESNLNEFSLNFGLSKQLPWENGAYKISFIPGYKYYNFENYTLVPLTSEKYTGSSHDINLVTTFVRDTQDDVFYPKKGNNLTINFVTTPPYGLFKKQKNYSLVKKLKFRDYGVFTIEDQQALNIWKDLVLAFNMKMGASFSYSDELILNRFQMGGGIGNKIMTYGILSQKNVPLRGYADNNFKGNKNKYGIYGGQYFSTMTAELRFLLIDSGAMFKFYILGFFDSGLMLNDFSTLTMESIKKSIGLGCRFFVPMLGILGFDFGYGIDKKSDDKWEFHFQIGV